MAAKIAMGYTLDEIVNPVTGQTYACFEPTLDYIVSKIPRWPFDKFISANRKLGTQMKATGEVMAIGRTFEESIHKAVRSLEIGVHRLYLKDAETLDEATLNERLIKADDERIFLIAEAFRRGYTLQQLQDLTKIDWWFLDKIEGLIAFEDRIREESELSSDILYQAKRLGFTDRAIAELRAQGQPGGTLTTEAEVRTRREAENLRPVYKMVDTCAAEFEATTPYYYSTYETENEVIPSDKKKLWCWVQDQSGSVKGSSSTTQLYTQYGHCKKQAMKQSLSTITRRRCLRTLIHRIACTLNRSSSKMS